AVLRGNAHVVAELAQRHVTTAGAEAQSALQPLLLYAGYAAAMPARCDARAPVERLELAGLDAVAEHRFVLRLLGVAMHRRAIGVHLGELLAELEALALLPARRVARALEDPAAPGAAPPAGGHAAEEDRGSAFAQRGDADLRARFAVDEAPLQRRQDDIFARELPGAVRVAAGVEHEQRRAAAQLDDALASFRFL